MISPKKKRCLDHQPPPVQAKDRPDYVAMMLTAPITDVTEVTPLKRAEVMSNGLGCEVYLKREDVNLGFGYHIRTAYTIVAGLSKEQMKGTVVASGLGNFNYCVGLACKKVGFKGKLRLVCPLTTTANLLSDLGTITGFDIEILKHGADVHEARVYAENLCNKTPNAVHVHPFEGPEPIAALGSIGVEIFRQVANPTTIYVGVGTGGLLAAIKEYAEVVHPGVEVVGVEAEGNCALRKAIEAGKVVEIEGALNHFVEGSAVATANDHAVEICRVNPPRIITVTNDEICAAIKATFTDTRTIVEPSGALAVAGLKKDLLTHAPVKTHKKIAILGSANMEFAMLRTVAERCEEREVLVTVDLPEEKGSFNKMYHHIYPRQVTEFSYRFNGGGGAAKVFMSFQLSGKETGEAVIDGLNKAGFATLALRDNEMAKSHARYMVGGRGAPPDERLYRFQFPENSEALKNFLSALPSFVNITLFHYRNHGADFGKVLVGFDVPVDQEVQFQDFLASVAYEFEDETTNPVYRLFLR